MFEFNYKKIIGLLAVVLVLSAGLIGLANKDRIVSKVNIAWAEEDEEDEEDEDDDDERVINTSPDNDVVRKTETKTIYTKLSDTVSTTTTTITKYDSDGDGVYDEEDPHPTINENFIVKDDDLNGIDDRYEQ